LGVDKMVSEESFALDVPDTKVWIYAQGLQGRDRVLIINHGGPGSTLMPFSKGFDGELLKTFSVVHWDQRGAGKSFDKSVFSNGLSISQFVQDTKAVVEWVRKRAPGKKV